MVEKQQVLDLISRESVQIDRGAIGELYETALRFVGIGVGGILYTAGKKGGARGALLLNARLGIQGNELLEAAVIAFNQSNWGYATLKLENGLVRVIQVENSALAASMADQKKPICHPIAGYIAGFLEEAWKRPVKVHEIQCIASGQPCCLFAVE